MTRHADDYVLEGVFEMRRRDFIPSMQDLANGQTQAAAEVTAGMETPEIRGAEISRTHQGNGQGMAER
jgi:hypothetical protein